MARHVEYWSSTGNNPGVPEHQRHPNSHEVFVGNIPHHMSENEVKTFFEHFGKVVEVCINKKQGATSVPNYGYVCFDDERTVQNVLDHKEGFLLLGGHRLNVEKKKQRGGRGAPVWARPDNKDGPNPDSASLEPWGGGRNPSDAHDSRRTRHPDSHQVFVGNLPHYVPEHEVKTFFEHFGKVVALRINKKPGTTIPNCGFVVFDDKKSVQNVLNHKGGFLLPGGHRLNVEEKKQRGGPLGSRIGRGGPAGARPDVRPYDRLAGDYLTRYFPGIHVLDGNLNSFFKVN